MKTKVPRFEGREVTTARIKVNGATDDRVGALAQDEEVFFIVKGTVSGISHEDVKNVYTRVHKVTPASIVIIERKDGERILTEAQMLADERFGLETLFNGQGEPKPPSDGEGSGEEPPPS